LAGSFDQPAEDFLMSQVKPIKISDSGGRRAWLKRPLAQTSPDPHVFRD
jgi:hypothetical protein